MCDTLKDWWQQLPVDTDHSRCSKAVVLANLRDSAIRHFQESRQLFAIAYTMAFLIEHESDSNFTALASRSV